MANPQSDATTMIALTAAGGIAGVFVLCACVLLVARLCLRRHDAIRRSSKTPLLCSGFTPSIRTTLVKQIPFTVPYHITPPGERHGESRHAESQEDDSTTLDPSTPPVKRPSVEIPGAFTLGNIDPSLYKIADEDDAYDITDDHIGRIWFAVQYEHESEKLLVTLIKAKNLPSRVCGNVNACDPFVRIFLTPDERRYMQSKFRKKTCNPKFEETYVFQVSNKSLSERVLRLTVYDVDRHRRHNIIGHAIYPLSGTDCAANERLVLWRDLEREVTELTAVKGDILVSLCYNNNTERLTVGVFEGRSFKSVDVTTPIDCYMKVSLLIQNKVIKTKKTDISRKSCDPNFNESFAFKLPTTSLDTASVAVSAVQHFVGQKDKTIGRIVLGSFMFARGKELDHWNEMVANQRDQISVWHSIT